jgi:heme-binding protein
MKSHIVKQLGRVVKWGALAFCVAFIAIQLVPVSRTNPAVQSEFRGSPELVSVLRRACYDCHSNETVWPWYSRVAPLSWIIAHDVSEGRADLNFSTWNQLSPQKQAEAIKESWEEVAEGKMPTWYYVIVHPKARLSPNDQSILRAWAGSPASREKGGNDDDD